MGRHIGSEFTAGKAVVVHSSQVQLVNAGRDPANGVTGRTWRFAGTCVERIPPAASTKDLFGPAPNAAALVHA